MGVYGNLHEREIYDEGFDVGELDVSHVPAVPAATIDEKSSVQGQTTKRKVTRRKDMTGSSGAGPFALYVDFAKSLVRDFGVSHVGGCCGCGPDGISALHTGLHK